MPKEAKYNPSPVIAVPVTCNLKQKIKKKAKQSHTTMSGYVRGLVLEDLEK
tara:strand:+ start:4817 stop:4969 length:153 start_codon:yes stop_codon:yes gene_type:complete